MSITSKSAKHIVIIAGEESGDSHAAHLVTQLLQNSAELMISGIGGKHMQKAGVNLLCDLTHYSVTGMTEVFRHLFVFKKALTQIKDFLAKNKPDLLILVDYPEFNLRLAKFAKQTLNLRVIYYISPQIWAWKAKRIHTIRQNVDHMAVILPFEKQIYQNGQVPVSFVGHPLVANLQKQVAALDCQQLFNVAPNSKIVALLPGSRNSELQRHMPIFMETVARLIAQQTQLHFVIPVAKTLSLETVREFIPVALKQHVSLVEGRAAEVILGSDCVVVASGTASLECALLGKPMCIVYKGSWLSYLVAMRVIKVKYLGLCNLLQNKMLVPELLQQDCNPTELTAMIQQLLISSDIVQKMLAGFKNLQTLLSEEHIDESLLNLVTRYLYT